MKQIKIFLLCVASFAATISAQTMPGDIVESVRSRYAPDKRVAVWALKAELAADSSVVVRGDVENRQAVADIAAALTSAGYTFRDSITVLPDETVKKPWALVSISVACMRGRAASSAELVSQAIMGTPMRVLKSEDGMSLVQTPDNYLGYMTDSSMTLLSDEEFAQWRSSKRCVVTAYQASLYSDAKADESCIVSDLLLGNILKFVEKKGKFIKVELPDGRQGYVKKNDISDFAEWVDRKFDINLIERNARRMMGSPYLWGGMSSKMADCSGFVKTAYFSNGIILQRDASQQVHTGGKIDWHDWAQQAQKGDLIFIGTKSGRVTHVAMYLDKGKYIHSSGRVKINSMDPNAEDYLDYTFISMSRINGYVGTKGITAVKSHPWYIK